MMILLAFDLSRSNSEEIKCVNIFRKKIIRMGFEMNQYSLYEKYIRNEIEKSKVIEKIKLISPSNGEITLFFLPIEVYNSQMIIVGKKVQKKISKDPKIIVV